MEESKKLSMLYKYCEYSICYLLILTAIIFIYINGLFPSANTLLNNLNEVPIYYSLILIFPIAISISEFKSLSWQFRFIGFCFIASLLLALVLLKLTNCLQLIPNAGYLFHITFNLSSLVFAFILIVQKSTILIQRFVFSLLKSK
jgi:hypothetical protein